MTKALYLSTGERVTQDLYPFGEIPDDAIALKFNDEISGPEWVTSEERLTELRREDAPLAYVREASENCAGSA